MSSDHPTRRLTLLGLLALAGCGFAPIYGEGTGYREQIAFESDDSVVGFRLNERLEERLGVSAAPRYTLKSSIRTSQRAAAITADGDTARLNIIGTADWMLTDIATGVQVDGGEVEAFTSYSATGSTIATQSTRDDAAARLAVILADLIVSRLLIAAPGPAQ